MTDGKPRCRYLRENDSQCPHPALAPLSNILLCLKHTASGIEMLNHAPDPDETPESRMADNAMRLAAAQREAESVVYYVQFRDVIKIGTTHNMRSRMQSVPNERVLATEPGDMRLERRRHMEFKHCRQYGEWFTASDPKLQAHIHSIQEPWQRRRNTQKNVAT
jgi:hypothetical protein